MYTRLNELEFNVFANPSSFEFQDSWGGDTYLQIDRLLRPF